MHCASVSATRTGMVLHPLALARMSARSGGLLRQTIAASTASPRHRGRRALTSAACGRLHQRPCPTWLPHSRRASSSSSSSVAAPAAGPALLFQLTGQDRTGVIAEYSDVLHRNGARCEYEHIILYFCQSVYRIQLARHQSTTGSTSIDAAIESIAGCLTSSRLRARPTRRST